jgi:hypothetical protein
VEDRWAVRMDVGSGGEGPGMSWSLLSLSSSFYFLLVLFRESHPELCAMRWKSLFYLQEGAERSFGSLLCHWFM